MVGRNIWFVVVNCIDLDQDRERWWGLMDIVKNLGDSIKCG